ncbi:MAG TPA: GNAT family N-acetyltransferase [Streptosporangiaceae bacterium]|nr:GNAT family N-acetyltransferase [Streptosporangiaceae bacterium]
MLSFRVEVVTGSRYLPLATTLLQRTRLRHPTGGIWEAADVQWWSRLDQATDQDGQLFWLDERAEPLAAVLLTSFARSTQCDVVVLSDDPDFARSVWQAALSRPIPTDNHVEFPVRLDDSVGIAELSAAGLSPSNGPNIITCWLDADHAPKIPPLADGYRLMSRADAPHQPHPMIGRNGPHVERRLRRCSLYQPELDLSVIAPDGQIAGYGLFWADQATRVGLVEPMRTEQAHERRGIASHLLAEGLTRLVAHGCQRLKVSNDIGIYLRAGFAPLTTATAAIYSRR